MTLETVSVTRYVTPLREGGSLPGIVEADDLGTYVCKFRGAGQGTRVLVAEVIVSGLAQRIGLSTPRLVVLDLDPAIARYEADEEVQDLLNASPGPNLGVDFLPGAFGYDGELDDADDPVGRPDPVARRLHGQRRPLLAQPQPAAVARRGLGDRPRRRAVLPPRLDQRRHDAGAVRRSALGRERPRAAAYLGRLAGVDAEVAELLGHDVFAEVLAEVPDTWLEPVPGAETPEQLRAAYVDFLDARLATRQWLPVELAS